MRSHYVLALLLFGASCSSSQPPPKAAEVPPPSPRADLVLIGGAVETLDPAVSGATALAVKEGKIARVGSDEEIKKWIGPDTKVIKLEGRVAVPGLVDSHAHLQNLGMRRFGVDLVGTASLEEVRARVKKAVAGTKKGAWIRGRGWDQNDWEAFRKKGLKFPTAKDLDDITPDNPVVLERIDGHAVWANSKAMAIAGVAKVKVKEGGEIIKAGGRPTGIFVDNAQDLIYAKVPAPSAEELKSALAIAQKDCLAAGLTQVHDMGIGASTLAVLKGMDESGDLRLRVYAMLDGTGHDLTALMGSGPIIPRDDKSRLTVRGVKFFIDGALGSRGAALLRPYNDDKKNSGLLTMQPDVLEQRVRAASQLGYQVATHAIGDRGNRIVLDIYERVLGTDSRRLRPRVEHAQVVSLDDLPRFSKDGVIASMQPTHATSDMPWAEKRIGKDRLQGAYAWKTLLTSGATIAAGSDAPVEDISPVLGLYAAVTRMDEFGSPAGGWMPEQRMTPTEALASFTRGGAYASFREEEAGMIKEGFVADVTVLDHDPISAPGEELNTLQVMLTIISGSVEYARAGADNSEVKTSSTTRTSTAAH